MINTLYAVMKYSIRTECYEIYNHNCFCFVLIYLLKHIRNIAEITIIFGRTTEIISLILLILLSLSNHATMHFTFDATFPDKVELIQRNETTY